MQEFFSIFISGRAFCPRSTYLVILGILLQGLRSAGCGCPFLVLFVIPIVVLLSYFSMHRTVRLTALFSGNLFVILFVVYLSHSSIIRRLMASYTC